MSDDGVAWYLQQAGRIPLLTPSEEISLGNEVQAYMAIRDLPNPTAAQKKIIKRGLKAKNRIFNANLRLVVHISKKYAEANLSTMTMLDLIQEGNIGLSRAIEKFDPSRGYKFSTYAYWWVRQAVTRSISMSDRSIRLPINAITIQKKVARFAEAFKEENGRHPTMDECAKYCEIRPCTMRAYLEHTPRISSLDQLTNPSSKLYEETTILDLISGNESSPEEELEIQHGLEQLDELMADIPERDRWALELRFGIDELGPLTYVAIGKILNISRERVRQIEARWLRKMRLKMHPLHRKQPPN